MAPVAQGELAPLALPKIVFVLGKGGVGRSAVATGLGLALTARGERVLIMEWTVEEAIAPWFGLPSMDAARAGTWTWMPGAQEIAPGLSVFNYRLHEALRGYFVDHLGLPVLYRRIIDGPHVRRLIEAAPGIAELLFIGQLWWMTTLAPAEAGLHFDRIVVDAPATGHGASLLDLPATLATFGATGLLAMEVQRVVSMLADPARVGALVVALPEELALEETLELVPRVTRDLGRPPLAAFVNRSVAGLVDEAPSPSAFADLRLSLEGRRALTALHGDLWARVRLERELRSRLVGQVTHGTWSLQEQLAAVGRCTPREVAAALGARLGQLLPKTAGARP